MVLEQLQTGADVRSFVVRRREDPEGRGHAHDADGDQDRG
jgi:hypothetical protein